MSVQNQADTDLPAGSFEVVLRDMKIDADDMEPGELRDLGGVPDLKPGVYNVDEDMSDSELVRTLNVSLGVLADLSEDYVIRGFHYRGRKDTLQVRTKSVSRLRTVKWAGVEKWTAGEGDGTDEFEGPFSKIQLRRPLWRTTYGPSPDYTLEQVGILSPDEPSPEAEV